MPIVALNGGLAEWLPLKSIQDFFNIVDYKMYTSIVYIFYNKRYIYTIFMYMVYRTHDPILKEFRESNFPFEWVWVTHCQINIEEKKIPILYIIERKKGYKMFILYNYCHKKLVYTTAAP